MENQYTSAAIQALNEEFRKEFRVPDYCKLLAGRLIKDCSLEELREEFQDLRKQFVGRNTELPKEARTAFFVLEFEILSRERPGVEAARVRGSFVSRSMPPEPDLWMENVDSDLEPDLFNKIGG